MEFNGYMTVNEYECLKRYAANASVGIVDIGTYNGSSAKILRMSSLNTIPVWSIDCYNSSVASDREPLNIFYSNLNEFENIFLLIGKSQSIGRHWRTPFDLLVIDGSHVYEDVMQDFEVWSPSLTNGGIVIFHDAANIENSFLAINGKHIQANDGPSRAIQKILGCGWNMLETIDTIAVLKRNESIISN